MRITKYEQSGFILETEKGFRLAFDIAKMTPLEKLDGVPPVDLFVVSHIHGDHFSPEHIAKLAPKTVILPRECYDILSPDENRMITAGMFIADENMRAVPGLNSNLIISNDGFVFENDQVAVTFFHVDHGPNVSAPVDNYGFLIEADGQKIYFAGDMFYASGIDVSNLEVDHALIPVGGHYTFGPKEAAAFVKQFKKIGQTIPMHYEKTPETKNVFLELTK